MFLPKPGSGPDLTLAAMILLIWVVWTIAQMWGAPALDLTALYMAGRLWADGAPDLIYAVPEGFFGAAPPHWQNRIVEYGLGGISVTPFVYPPLWPPALAALARESSVEQWFEAWRIVLVPALAACVPLAWRIAQPGLSLVVTAVLAIGFLEVSHIPRFALSLGQPQILITALTLLAFERKQAGWSMLAGVLLALTASMKLLPAILALIFIVDRDWRAVTAFVVTGGTLFVVSLIVAGTQIHHAYAAALAEMESATLVSVYNPSVKALLGAMQYPQQAASPLEVLWPLAGWVRVAGPVLFVAAIAVWLRQVTRLTDGQSNGRALLSLSLIALVFAPLGWLHYYLLPVLLMPCLVPVMRPMRAMGMYLLVLLGSSSWLVAGILPFVSYGSLAYQAIFVAAALVVAWVALTRTRQQFAPNAPHLSD